GRYRRLDHGHRTAGVDLVAGHVGVVGEDRLVDQSAPTRPGIIRGQVREYGYEGEVPMLALPLAGQLVEIEIGRAPDAPVEAHRAAHAAAEGILENALDRREAGGAGDEQDRTLAFPEGEATERSFELDGVADL